MQHVLTINGGSSSVRFAIFQAGQPAKRVLGGKMERMGSEGTTLTTEAAGEAPQQHRVAAQGRESAIAQLLQWLEAQPQFASLAAAGHRIVHGMERYAPALVTPDLLQELKRNIAFDPEHLPRELELIEAVRQRQPKLRQVVCFDTAFHHGMPQVAKLLPIPRRYAAKGVRRYGFHGLSYTYLLQELRRLGDAAAGSGRVILAHLGSGASVAAVRDGAGIDTSMGFTPSSGLVMGTRTGDLDPGLMSYLSIADGLTSSQFSTLVNHESGLLGVSETSADVRDLLQHEDSDPRAAEALELFCYQAKKWIGSLAAALGGLDTLVFSGGVGENAAPIRLRICEGLQFLGVEIDEAANSRHAPQISRGAVTVRIIHTDEESIIADSSIKAARVVTDRTSACSIRPPPKFSTRTCFKKSTPTGEPRTTCRLGRFIFATILC